jgi:hypothetical protein
MRCSCSLNKSFQVILDSQWVMLLVTTKGAGRDSLNHVHDVWCIPTTLERALQYVLDLLPYEVKDTKIKSIGSPSHSHTNVSAVGSLLQYASIPMVQNPL